MLVAYAPEGAKGQSKKSCILLFRKLRHKPNLESTSKYGFSPDLVGKNCGVLNMRMKVILDSTELKNDCACHQFARENWG